MGISDGHKIGTLHKVSQVFRGLSREPYEGIRRSTSGYSLVDHSVVGGYTGRIGQHSTHRQRIGLIKHSGQGIHTSEVVGNGYEVSTCRDVVQVLGGLVVGPKVGQRSISGGYGKIDAAIGIPKAGRWGELHRKGSRNQRLREHKGVGDHTVVGIGDGYRIGSCKEVVDILGGGRIVPKVGIRRSSSTYGEVNGPGTLGKTVDVL